MNIASLKTLFVVALSSLFINKLRSLLSMLGIVFGIISMISLFLIGEGAKNKILSQFDQLGVNNIIIKRLELTKSQEAESRDFLSRGLSEADVVSLRSVPRYIDRVIPIKTVRASILSIGAEYYPEILSTTAGFGVLYEDLIETGRFLCDLDLTERNFVCVLGSDIAGKLGPTSHVGGSIRLQNEVFRVVGILQPRRTEPKDSSESPITIRDLGRVIIIPLGTESYLEQGRPLDGYSEIIVSVRKKQLILPASSLIRTILQYNHNKAEDYQIIIPLELVRQQQKTQRNLNVLLIAIALISLVVGGIGIMNIMLATISERMREIGIRRALGASQSHIQIQFLAESVLIALSGGVIGCVGGILIVIGISIWGGWNPVVKLWFVIFSIAIAFGVGLFSGIYPARKAARMDPLEALRHE